VMDDLVKWLRVQLDVDANWAYAASARERVEGSEWRWDKHAVFADGGDHVADAIRSTAVAGHIAHHDPARVLREVEAKRLLLEDLLAQPHFLDEGEWYGCRSIRHSYTDERGTMFPEPDGRDLPTGQPCTCGRDESVARRVRALALPYADQPGYQEAWKP
jgi:hypothetical protein